VKHLTALLTALSLLLLAACGASSSSKLLPAAVRKPPEDPWSWVPENGTTIGRLDLSELRRTPFWPLWSEVEREQKLTSWVDLNKVERITFGGAGKSRDDLSYVASLEGAFSERELVELAARDQIVAEKRGLLTLYRRPEGVWTQITSKLIVVATLDRLDELVARAESLPGAKAKETALYRSLADRVELASAHAVLLAEDPDGSGRAQLERHASRVGLGTLTRDSVRLGVGVQVGADYRVVAASETADAAHAELQQAELKQTLDSLSRNFIVRMLGMGSLLARLQVSGEGNYVYLRGTLPEVDLANALKRVHGALGLAQGVGL
jgi:hypothetical protein